MKNANGEAIADVLGKVAQAIRGLDETQIEAVRAGEFRVELILECPPQPGEDASGRREAKPEKDVTDVAQLLCEIENRDDGLRLLELRLPTKALLTDLARHLDLPLQKRESTERLREKIIEATIGFRLRSRAIRGTDNLEKTAG